MGMKENLMGTGVPAETAAIIEGYTITSAPILAVSNTLTATGTVIGDALSLPSIFNIITTAAAGTGVKLPSNLPIGQTISVINSGAQTVNVFPHSASGTINSGSAGAAITVANAGVGSVITRVSSTNWIARVMGAVDT